MPAQEVRGWEGSGVIYEAYKYPAKRQVFSIFDLLGKR